MDLLIAPYTVIKEQADKAPVTGTPGWATDGNPSVNKPATQWPAYAFNAIQEELASLILSAGLDLNRNDNTQVLSALQKMLAPLAALESPTFTGNPQAPTPEPTDVSNRLATTAFVHAAVALRAAGQCRLVLSGGSIALVPFAGNQLYINGSNRSIPGAGISLAPAGLTVGTTYYIYAYWAGSAIALEASATGHSTDPSSGVEIKSGDATRTLVGMARPVSGPAWKDDIDNRYVLSWFNRRLKASRKQLTANVTLTAAGPAEVSTSLRNDFICWENGVTSAAASGAAQIGASSTFAFRLALNGAAIGNWLYGANLLASNAATALGLTDLSPDVPEGANYITLAYTRGSGSGNADVTGTFNGNTNVQVQIQG